MILYRNGFKWLVMLLIAASAVIGAPAAHAKSPVVTGVQVNGASGKLKVNVTATGEVQYRVLNLNDPRPQLVVEIFPAQLATDVSKSTDVNAGEVEKVRMGQFSDNPDVVRLVVDLKSAVKYQVSLGQGHKRLTLALDTTASTAVTHAAPVVKAPAAATLAVAPALKGKAAVRVAEAGAPDVSPSHTYVVHNSPAGAPAEIAKGSKPRRSGKSGAASAGTGKAVTLDFVNADLIYVLKILAKELKLNLVTDSTVKGSVTMALKDVPPSAALQLILKIQGFDYKIFGSTLVVGAADTLGKIPADIMGKQLPKAGDVNVLPIPLENAKAAAVADTIKGVYPDAKVTVQADQNFVVVTASKGQLRDIKEFVQKLDVPPPPPVVLKTEIVPVKYGTVQGVLNLAKPLYPSLGYTVDDRLNSLIVTGQDRDIEALKAFLATVDIPLQQVMLDIRIVVLNEDGSKILGFSIGSSDGTFGVFGAQGGRPITFTESLPLVNGAAATTTPSLAIAPFNRTPFVIGATLSMLVSRNDAKVIATPRVMTQSGKEASVLIGDKYPIVYFDPRAGQFQVQYIDIGTKLGVKPTVTADGFVVMDLTPEQSTLKALINNQYPETQVVTVKTNVRVRDGDTVVIGGLLRETEKYTLSKLPFLGDLPVLGELFRQTNIQRQKDETFVTVTPKVM
ncbi:MAG: type IV pilus secretin family protein [Proteobacteria bacterium]|nr:type IV pilus secretin family protein [Pseudomonadota bacterium]